MPEAELQAVLSTSLVLPHRGGSRSEAGSLPGHRGSRDWVTQAAKLWVPPRPPLGEGLQGQSQENELSGALRCIGCRPCRSAPGQRDHGSAAPGGEAEAGGHLGFGEVGTSLWRGQVSSHINFLALHTPRGV